MIKIKNITFDDFKKMSDGLVIQIHSSQNRQDVVQAVVDSLRNNEVLLDNGIVNPFEVVCCVECWLNDSETTLLVFHLDVKKVHRSRVPIWRANTYLSWISDFLQNHYYCG